MSKEFKPIGKWVAVKTELRKETISEAGIIYKEAIQSNLYTWSEVVSVSDDVEEDIQPGDKAYWKLGTNKGAHYEDGDEIYDLVNIDDIEAVDRNETE